MTLFCSTITSTIYLHMYVYMLVIVEMQMSTLALNVFTICLRIINNQPKNLTNYETTKSRSFIENRRGPPVITSSSTASSPKCKEGKATSGFNSKQFSTQTSTNYIFKTTPLGCRSLWSIAIIKARGLRGDLTRTLLSYFCIFLQIVPFHILLVWKIIEF